MALLKFNNIGLQAIAAMVSHMVVKTTSLTEYNSDEKKVWKYGWYFYTILYGKDHDKIKPNNYILMNAISASFAYGTAVLNIADCKILEEQNYNEGSIY